MTRLVPIAAALAALIGLLFLPDADRGELAVLASYEAALEGEVIGADGEARPLGQVLLTGPARLPATPERPARFLLGGVRLVDSAPSAEPDLGIHGELRTALLRALRQAAMDEGLELEFVGQDAPAVHGLNLLATLGEEQLTLTWGVRPAGSDTEQGRGELALPFDEPGPLSLLPPLVAIALAVALRRPVLSLSVGVLAGALLLRLRLGEGPLEALGRGTVDVVAVFLRNEVQDGDRLLVVGFVVAMLAMVGVITRNGGIRGLMNLVARLARGARSTQVATYAMGLLVFFDDYANTILVGSTMRPLTDRFRIAREKLAYIVDSTAAPVAVTRPTSTRERMQ